MNETNILIGIVVVLVAVTGVMGGVLLQNYLDNTKPVNNTTVSVNETSNNTTPTSTEVVTEEPAKDTEEYTPAYCTNCGSLFYNGPGEHENLCSYCKNTPGVMCDCPL